MPGRAGLRKNGTYELFMHRHQRLLGEHEKTEKKLFRENWEALNKLEKLVEI